MPVTRSASRGNSAATTPSSSPQTSKTGAGTKRKAEGTPSKAKRGKTDDKTQKTIEQTLDSKEETEHNDIEMKDADASKTEKAKSQEKSEESKPEEGKKSEEENPAEIKSVEKEGEPEQTKEDATEEKPSAPDQDTASKSGDKTETKQEGEGEKANHSDKQDNKDAEAQDSKIDDAKLVEATKQAEKESEQKKSGSESGPNPTNGSAVETDESRKKAEPSNILEKGLIYFFFRGRVGVEDPSAVTDIQRSYILLRPLPSGATLNEGPVPSGGKARILALPKKTLPSSARDRFLCWVEAAHSSFDDIKKQHLDRAEYTTKTQGARATPAAQPAAEGIYAITTTGRESHLAYILTVPENLGDVQRDLGLATRGAFITSVRNPETSAPTGTVPDQKASYSKEIMDEFAGRRWGRLEPKHLDYQDTQFLLIGEHETDKLEKSVKADEGDGTKEGKNEPVEELELLEKEDEERINALKGDDSDAIFKDLGLSKDDFSKIKTEW